MNQFEPFDSHFKSVLLDTGFLLNTNCIDGAVFSDEMLALTIFLCIKHHPAISGNTPRMSKMGPSILEKSDPNSLTSH